MFGEYTPLMKPMLIARRMERGTAIIDDELGLQKLCPSCHEFWPQDTLFWSVSSREADGLQCHCKACQDERRSERTVKDNERRNAA
ncbi:hypothetical protein HRJ35_14890 [Shewanella oneidensis MR-1]|uniref:Mu phage uncharacterized protein n=1 Tax=Shewanella oneidensis (strain ATCC 700550 / JCM 31522 / CIP 106686 / LMG 19005 / NCIMB 14063 / MR-1) TaxID=211586 RepID=Q8EDS8_SHEON|nr:hypothetical protein [Shewanella oneidensis]AAN55693.1 Mu phage uncharacterized protein [Shewanella oneidensis MR-1]MDX5995666.1 hypothetical protein [Shewanella oneidensis]MEE2026283.1 hypothetical protein [Shewanella oneidensis]QKG97167.1 hypothetical protein HRJ35_14890 [Shewanella oneidensis MR-1]